MIYKKKILFNYYLTIIKNQKQKIKHMWKKNKTIDSNTNFLLKNEIIKYMEMKQKIRILFTNTNNYNNRRIY